MKRRVASALLLAFLVAPCAVLASGKSYMALVGELVGSVQSPRIIRDYCAVHSPSTAVRYAKLYDEWAARHGALLAAIDEQAARAAVRLKKQGAPGGDKPIEWLIATITDSVLAKFDGYSSAQAEQVCSGYPKLLEAKDEEAEGEIPRLLSIVSDADKSLTTREQT
jgi:hypothetical protein